MMSSVTQLDGRGGWWFREEWSGGVSPYASGCRRGTGNLTVPHLRRKTPSTSCQETPTHQSSSSLLPFLGGTQKSRNGDKWMKSIYSTKYCHHVKTILWFYIRNFIFRAPVHLKRYFCLHSNLVIEFIGVLSNSIETDIEEHSESLYVKMFTARHLGYWLFMKAARIIPFDWIPLIADVQQWRKAVLITAEGLIETFDRSGGTWWMLIYFVWSIIAVSFRSVRMVNDTESACWAQFFLWKYFFLKKKTKLN